MEDNKGIAELGQEAELEEQSSEQQQDQPALSEGEQQTELQKQDEEKNLKSLDTDEDFQKSVPKNYNQDRNWRKLYWQRKEAERKAKELEEQLNTLSQEKEDKTPPEIDENTLVELAKTKGYTLSKQEKKELGKLEDYINQIANPTERQALQQYTDALLNKMGENLSPFMNQVSEMLIEYRLEKSEKQARGFIDAVNKKHGLKIDYDKDVDPELAKMVRGNKKLTPYNTDLLALTKEFLAERGVEFGKRLSQKEMQELNEKKRKANIEAPSPSALTPGSDEGKSLRDMFREEAARENLTGF